MGQLLLREPPPGFLGWIDLDAGNSYSAEIWEALGSLGDGVTPMKLGIGLRGAAQQLRALSVPALKELSLGELQHVITIALGHGVLVYKGHHVCTAPALVP